MRTQNKITLLILAAFLLAFTAPAMANSYSDAINNFKKSPAVRPFFQNAYGYAVFPLVGKGGFVVGAAYGKGLVYEQRRIAGNATLFKATLGFQVGGQAFSEVIFFQDKRAYDEFTSGNFQFDASASAVVVTAALQAKAGTDGTSAGASIEPFSSKQLDTRYQRGMATFIQTKGGFMYEASIGGQYFTFESKY